MKTKNTLLFASAVLCLTTSAHAYTLGSWDLSGVADLTGIWNNDHVDQHARFNKYRDIYTGARGDFSLSGETGSYYMDLRASDIGRLDQEYSLSGGQYSSFDYKLFYNQIINRKAVSGVQGPWDGAGTGTLTPHAGVTFPFAANNYDGTGYAPFEYSVKHKTFGAKTNLLKDSPFYATLGFDQDNQSGIRAMAINDVLSTGTNVTVQEVPEPLDYTIRNYRLDVGYRADDWSAGLDGLVSTLGSNIKTLHWQPVYSATLTDTTMLTQDNTYFNGNAKATLHRLPLESTLGVKVGYSRITSKFDMLTQGFLDGTGTAANNAALVTTPATTDTVFDGKVEYKTANIAVDSRPVEKLDTRLHYGFLQKKNTSPQVSYTGLAVSGANTNNGTSGTFGYRKQFAGADASYRFPVQTKFGLGYEYLFIHRDRDDVPSNKDHRVTAQLSNSSLDWMTARIKYAYLARLSEETLNALPFDAATQHRNSLGLEVDLNPVDRLDVVTEYTYARSKFNNTARGLNDAWSHLASLSVGYDFSSGMRLSAFGDGEWAYTETRLSFPGTSGYAATESDLYWTAGTALQVPVIHDSLDFTGAYQYRRGNGAYNFVTDLGTAAQDIPNLDDYIKHELNTKFAYKVTKNLIAKVGYIFERLIFSDVTTEGYRYYQTRTAGASFTGAFADNSYLAHVGYLTAEYTF